MMASAAAIATFLIIEVLGLNLMTPVMGDGGKQFDVGGGNVAFVSALAGIAGWLTLAAAEKATANARKTWTILASVALGLSFAGPFGGSGLAIEGRLGLALLHVVVASVLITGFRRTARL